MLYNVRVDIEGSGNYRTAQLFATWLQGIGLRPLVDQRDDTETYVWVNTPDPDRVVGEAEGRGYTAHLR